VRDLLNSNFILLWFDFYDLTHFLGDFDLNHLTFTDFDLICGTRKTSTSVCASLRKRIHAHYNNCKIANTVSKEVGFPILI